jgi:hypothetical protein
MDNDDTLRLILSFLDSRYVYTTIPLVCKRFDQICKNRDFWKLLLYRESGINITKEMQHILWAVYYSQHKKWTVYLFEHVLNYTILDTLYVKNGEGLVDRMQNGQGFVDRMQWWADSINYRLDTVSPTRLMESLKFFDFQFHETFTFKPKFIPGTEDHTNTTDFGVDRERLKYQDFKTIIVINKKTGEEYEYPAYDYSQHATDTSHRRKMFNQYYNEMFYQFAQKTVESQNLEPDLEDDIVKFIRNYTYISSNGLFILEKMINNGEVEYIKGYTWIQGPSRDFFYEYYNDHCRVLDLVLEDIFTPPDYDLPSGQHRFHTKADAKIMVKHKVEEWTKQGVLLPEPCKCQTHKKQRIAHS